ncbi:MAG: sel1 repeat family protein, partial [Thermoguttaceae bacterium]|nr:sel1 repeat family protein [Thermoguttaceae bacterium]
AAEYWTIAAEAGNRDAMERLARCYLRGDGVEQDPDEATRWLLRSGVLGESDDICARAIMLDSEGKVQVVNFIEPDYRGFFGFFRRIFDAIAGIFRRRRRAAEGAKSGSNGENGTRRRLGKGARRRVFFWGETLGTATGKNGGRAARLFEP